MKIVIVDDSRLARKELKDLLTALPQLRVVAEAADVAQAVAAVNEHKPDLLLLDIHLPDGDGFQVLERSDYTPQVIFTTAYEQHALRAFEFNALDYLLKPVTSERLSDAIQRLLAQQPSPAMSTKSRDDQIFVRDGDYCHFVRLGQVRLINVEGGGVRLYFGGKKALLNRTLNYIADRIDPVVFFRANRQQIVNLDYVANVEAWVNDGLLIRLNDNTEIEVSRRQARELKQKLEI